MLTKYKLRELIDVTRGMSLPGEYYSETGEYIRLTMGNFNYNGGGFKENTSKTDIYYTGPVREEFILNKGDIITPLTEQAIGLLGTTAMIPESGRYIQSQDVALISCKQDKIDHLFCYYLISSDIVKKQLSAAAQQTKIRHTSPDKIMDCSVWIPEMKLQQKIGKTLYEIDQKIALNTRMNAELEAMAKQLYDYWFVQFDFPDENGKPYKSSGGKMVYNPILKRDIPTGWEVKEISDFAEIKSGYPFKSENMNEYKGKYKIVTIRNVQENNLDLSNISYTDIIPDNIKSYCILKEKDILISLTGNVGRTCLVYENGLLLNQRVGLVQPKNSNVPWCYSIFKDKSIRTAVENWANGCAQANVSPLDIERLKIPVPSNDILQYFDKSVKPMIERQIKIAKQNNYLTHLRDSLLPMLMNGQVTI